MHKQTTHFQPFFCTKNRNHIACTHNIMMTAGLQVLDRWWWLIIPEYKILINLLLTHHHTTSQYHNLQPNKPENNFCFLLFHLCVMLLLLYGCSNWMRETFIISSVSSFVTKLDEVDFQIFLTEAKPHYAHHIHTSHPHVHIKIEMMNDLNYFCNMVWVWNENGKWFTCLQYNFARI